MLVNVVDGRAFETEFIKAIESLPGDNRQRLRAVVVPK